MNLISFPLTGNFTNIVALARGYVITAPVATPDSRHGSWESYVFCPSVHPYSGELYHGVGASPDEAIVSAVAVANLLYGNDPEFGPCPCGAHTA